MRNESGFVTTLFLCLLPLLFTIVILIAASGLIGIFYAEQLHVCRTGHFNAQRTLADGINTLINMNTRARFLRAEREQAEMEVRLTAMEPITHATALSHLASVISRQIQFGHMQKEVLRSAEKKADFEYDSSRITAKSNGAHDTERSHFQISMIRSPLSSPTPDYLVGPNFESQHTFRTRWTLNLKSKIPNWFYNWIKAAPNPIGQCTSTLKKESFQWKPALGRAKF